MYSMLSLLWTSNHLRNVIKLITQRLYELMNDAFVCVMVCDAMMRLSEFAHSRSFIALARALISLLTIVNQIRAMK